MALPFSLLDGFAKYTLVRLGPKRIGGLGDNFKRELATNDELAQKETDGTRHIETGLFKKMLRFLPKLRINSDL